MNSFLSPQQGLVVSIVSHGHGPLVHSLLADLARWAVPGVQRVVLTHNLPEADPVPPAQGWPFLLQVVNNLQPLGFGENHNRALAGATEPFVCVLNPDVELAGSSPFEALVRAAAQPGVGCAYPVQRDMNGRVQDSERAIPTPLALWRRRVLRRRDTRVDWVNAACIVLPQPVWQAVEGFDERYFMYCEDVDLCLRVRLGGWTLVRAPVDVVHGGQRASHRRWDHLRWHVRSLLRLWTSPVYRRALQLLPVATGGAGTIGTP
jgi:N-acetylglucosaminyl-diphospho-decaprenol L-rhamnosyltransferase